MLINAIPNDEAIPALMRKARQVTGGSGLHLIGGKTPTRHYWRLDYSVHGVRKPLGLRVFPVTDLQQARSLANQLRAMVDSELDPPAWRRALVLARTVPDMNGTAYNRSKHLAERREMLQASADYLDELRAGRFQSTRNVDAFTPISETENYGGAPADDIQLDVTESALANQIWLPIKQSTQIHRSTPPPTALGVLAPQHQQTRSCQS